MQMMDTSSLTAKMIAYYVVEEAETQKEISFDFHPSFIVFHKILILLKEVEIKNGLEVSDKDKMLIFGVASNNFDALENEQFGQSCNDMNSLYIPMKNSKIRRLVVKILAKLDRMNPKSASSASQIPSSASSNKGTNDTSKIKPRKLGLQKINEDDGDEKVDYSDDEGKEL
jgi:hypothetical protein